MEIAFDMHSTRLRQNVVLPRAHCGFGVRLGPTLPYPILTGATATTESACLSKNNGHLRLCCDVGRGVRWREESSCRSVRVFLPIELRVLQVRVPERTGWLADDKTVELHKWGRGRRGRGRVDWLIDWGTSSISTSTGR